MNYRHAFHAGNFADVVKHVVLSRVVAHLKDKPTAFRIVDTHAGAGVYDLASPEAERTGEWRDGIGRLIDAAVPPALAALLAPYLTAIAALNAGGPLRLYPGSPALVQAWLRDIDRLVACELEPAAAAALTAAFARDRRILVAAIDGWLALKAQLPPKERRGAVLIDPPFEAVGEFDRLTEALVTVHRRWASGIVVVWYPIKDRHDTDAFGRRLAGLGIAKILRAELTRARADARGGLDGTGLIVVNPPWRLEAELGLLLPWLAQVLAPDAAGNIRIDWLATEK